MKRIALTVAVLALGLTACVEENDEPGFTVDGDNLVIHEDPRDTGEDLGVAPLS